MKRKCKDEPIHQKQSINELLQLTKIDPETFLSSWKKLRSSTRKSMSSTSKHFSSITSFISHAMSLKQIRFPDKQIAQYCRENETSNEKILNIFQAYYMRFKWNYDNFNEIIILLSIAMKKISFKPNKQKDQEQNELLLKKSLSFLEDLITSKMILVCIASKDKQKSICQNFLYAKGFIQILIPQILDFELYSELIGLIESSNIAQNTVNLIGMNFLIQFMVISTTCDFMSDESQKKFKSSVMEILQDKKRFIIGLIWNVQPFMQKRVQFKEIAYPRRDVQASKINYLETTNDGKIYVNQKNTLSPEDWITGAYQKVPNGSVWRNINLKTVCDIYQFLFKLEVFASSPLIQELDLLIPDSDQFIEVFSKFLMGEKLVQVQANKNEKDSSNVIKNIFDIKKMLEGANKAQKDILKKELSKICSDSQDDQDSTGKSEFQLNTD